MPTLDRIFGGVLYYYKDSARQSQKMTLNKKIISKL